MCHVCVPVKDQCADCFNILIILFAICETCWQVKSPICDCSMATLLKNVVQLLILFTRWFIQLNCFFCYLVSDTSNTMWQGGLLCKMHIFDIKVTLKATKNPQVNLKNKCEEFREDREEFGEDRIFFSTVLQYAFVWWLWWHKQPWIQTALSSEKSLQFDFYLCNYR